MQIPSPRHKRNGIKENHKVDGTIELTIKAFKENRIFWTALPVVVSNYTDPQRESPDFCVFCIMRRSCSGTGFINISVKKKKKRKFAFPGEHSTFAS